MNNMNNNISALGFNGEYLDSSLENYHLGNGYRGYNPAIMAFTAPDDMSPFGKGGINPYVYCHGDPINNTDPTGHFNILGFASNIVLATFSAVSLGTAVLATVASSGTLLLPALGVIAASSYLIYADITQAIDDTHKNDSIGKQLKVLGINLAITVGAEFGGWAAGSIIKGVASEVPRLFRRITGRIVSTETDEVSAWTYNVERDAVSVSEVGYNSSDLESEASANISNNISEGGSRLSYADSYVSREPIVDENGYARPWYTENVLNDHYTEANISGSFPEVTRAMERKAIRSDSFRKIANSSSISSASTSTRYGHDIFATPHILKDGRWISPRRTTI